ncbi:MAG: class I SAM-dependent methyltransferase [Candidatus Zixiibacteriota bacterium]|nr:MAG: class I SAM-dependent methyltransferase [candidate division Zixibacteria bacterium]
MKPYQKFAEVYDLMGADDFSIRMTEYCFKIFRRFKIKPSTGLDLCCGTGSALLKFSERGLIMAGLDRSSTMLAMAAKKLKGRRVPLYHKSLPRFRILDPVSSRKTRRFDLITCFFDSLNYLTTKAKLKTAFKSVYNHLQPGGWFIFDMNTPAAMKILWGSQEHTQVTENLVSIWRNKYNPGNDSAACVATFFRKKGKTWERFDEVHIERAYSNTSIRKALKETGFMVRGFYRCFSFEKPRKGTYRIAVVAEKPARAG